MEKRVVNKSLTNNIINQLIYLDFVSEHTLYNTCYYWHHTIYNLHNVQCTIYIVHYTVNNTHKLCNLY